MIELISFSNEENEYNFYEENDEQFIDDIAESKIFKRNYDYSFIDNTEEVED